MNHSGWLAAIPFAFASLACHAAQTAPALLTSGVNDVQFNAQSEQAFLGSGFVIAHEGRFYGVTAKHVLLMRDGGPPANTDIQDQLHHWKLRDPRSTATLTLGKLLNGNASEAVTPDVLMRDTFLFEVADPGPFKPLQLASSEPKAGDKLHAVGCSYATESTCAQDTYSGTFLERKGPNLLIDLGSHDMSKIFGMSGAPVLNEAGRVVGIVSNVVPDSTGTQRFAPVDISYLREVLGASRARR